MITFLEFYETLLKFVNYKLFSSLDLIYPPQINSELEKTMDSFSYSTMIANNKEGNIESGINEEKYKIDKEFAEDETMKQIKNKYNNQHATLFDGLVFFCNREVPRYSLEFVILAFGGIVIWDSDAINIEDDRITHVITDRDPKFLKMKKNREYIQPQWVYDTINNQVLLPVAEYAPGKILPPHLSPFTDSKTEGGYKPERQIELEKLKGEYNENEEEKEDNENDYVDQNEEDQTYEVEKEVKKAKKIEKLEKQELKKLSETIMPKKKKKIYDSIIEKEQKVAKKGEKLTAKKESLRKKKQSFDEE
jgi:pescadillo protein